VRVYLHEGIIGSTFTICLINQFCNVVKNKKMWDPTADTICGPLLSIISRCNHGICWPWHLTFWLLNPTEINRLQVQLMTTCAVPVIEWKCAVWKQQTVQLWISPVAYDKIRIQTSALWTKLVIYKISNFYLETIVADSTGATGNFAPVYTHEGTGQTLPFATVTCRGYKCTTNLCAICLVLATGYNSFSCHVTVTPPVGL